MDNSLKNVLALGGIVTLTSLGLFFFGKTIMHRIRRKNQGKTNENLEGSEGDSGSQSQAQIEQEQAKKYNPSNDAKTIRGYLDGVNVYDYSENIMAILNKLSNAKLKKLAEHYKKTYKISLYQQLDDEWDLCGWGGFSDCYENPKKRLSTLNLR